MKSSRPSPPDQRLGVWRLQRQLAAVPSGQWWQVQHQLGRQPALALLYAEPADAGAVLLRMAQSPGQAWNDAALAWPLDAGLTPDGRAYVVMPAQEGEPLLAALPVASLRRRLGWLRQLAALLEQGQAQGLRLVELDPSLLWVDAQQKLRLQALALVREEAAEQRLGALQGALCAAAQPLHEGRPPAGEADIVQALLRLLGLFASGRLPGRSEPAPVALLAQWLSLSAHERNRLDALLQELLGNDAAQRPTTLAALGDALDAWLLRAATQPPTQPAPLLDEALPTPPAVELAAPRGAAAPAFAPAYQPETPPARAGRHRALLFVVLALVLGLLGAWWLLPTGSLPA